MLNLSPDVFWSLTLQELYCMADGYKFRQDQEWQKLAWQTMHLMNATGNFKKAIKMSDLINTSHNENKKLQPSMVVTDPKELKKLYDKIGRNAVNGF